MDISKIMKMDNSELQSEIAKRRKRILTAKSEIELLRRLIKMNSENDVSENENHFSEISESEINEMISDYEADFKAQP